MEKGDLEIHVSYGFICHGPIRDYAAIRDFIRTFSQTKLVYHTGSTRKLFIVKEGENERKEGRNTSEKVP